MGNGVGFVGSALLLDSLWPVVHGHVGPVVVASLQGLPGEKNPFLYF